MLTTFDISDPDISYFIGILLTDGSIYLNKSNPNKGRVSIEIKFEDREILLSFSELFPLHSSISTRVRRTNFSNSSKTSVWCCSRKELRDWLSLIQIPFGKKSQSIQLIPGVDVSHFWRGIIDGDGSLGFTKQGLPFISLVTSSEQLRNDYLEFIYSVTNKKFNPQRNERDGVYNILISKEDAIAVVNKLYPAGVKYNTIKRKQNIAQEMQKWQRPLNMPKRPNRKIWDLEQDKIVLMFPVAKAMELLNRSEASISCRKRRLKADSP